MRRSGVITMLLLLAVPALARPTKQRKHPAPAAITVRPAGEAARRLFVESDSAHARTAAAIALARKGPTPQQESDLLFIAMEAAALQADDAAVLRAAARLCELAGVRADTRAEIAAARILDLAQNTRAFAAVSARVQAFAAHNTPIASTLRAALLAAALDGAPVGDPRTLAHSAGLLTEWKLAGPFGKYANVDFDRTFAPERATALLPNYNGRSTEALSDDGGRLALPPYFRDRGVFYAAAEFETTQPEMRVRLESPGTVAVFIDGARVLTRDDRLEARPTIVSVSLRLAVGKHRLLAKFLSNAVPLRLSVTPLWPEAQVVAANPREANYLAASRAFWNGDPQAAVALLKNITQRSALESWLLAQAWLRIDNADAMVESAAVRAHDPRAYAASLALASQAADDEHNDEAADLLRPLVQARPELAEAQRLLGEVAQRSRLMREAAQAYEAALAQHPACGTLQAAARVAEAQMQYAPAAALLERLHGCAPSSPAYAQWLADAGRHADAAAAAGEIVKSHPFDRNARALLVRELLLAGEHEAARAAAGELHALAPNSPAYARLATGLAADTWSLADDAGEHDAAFAAGEEFFTPYRRDGIKVVRGAVDRVFSGGPAVVLLSDRVAQLRADGASSVYVHRITRVISRDGIEQYGEVALPAGARLLELRTIEPDGTFFEPELTHAKSTISMPALAPGDTIELEYVVYHRERGLEDHAEEFRGEFGSFSAPMLAARFVFITPPGVTPAITTSHAAPAMQMRNAGDTTVRVWERNDIAQSVAETTMPPARELLPAVQVAAASGLAWSDVADYWRDLAIEVSQAGPRVHELAAGLTGSEEDRARQLYRRVLERVTASEGSLAAGGANAEETLATREGNRTAVLLAAARIAGLRVALVMTRSASISAPQVATTSAYTRPLAEFRFGTRCLLVDAESEGFAFGQLAPATAMSDALQVGELGSSVVNAPIIALSQPSVREQSTADADVTLDAEGALSARVRITLGRWRSTQLRATLRSMPAGEQRHFFEQLAGRIFAGVSDANGEIRNAENPELPLELVLACRAPHYVAFSSGAVEIDQIVPTLGLRKMFAEANDRKFPLLIESVLVEASTFRVHLPRGVRVAELPASHEVRTAFGSYKAEFKATAPNEIVISRSFNVPAQTIEPERYREFARFAERIDAAERERIVLTRETIGALAAGK